MSDALRTCRRTGCRWPAAASLSFRYATREVWLETMPEQAHPAVYDLCPHHAEALTVPRGWAFTDRRPATSPPREPAGRDLPGAAAAGRPAGRPAAATPPTGSAPAEEEAVAPERCAAPNRYALLSAALPRLAAEHATGPAQAPHRTAPVADAETPAADGMTPPDEPEVVAPAIPEVEGQLAIPVPAEQSSRRS